MFERFDAGSRSAVGCAVDEAARRADRRVGTEHLLLGLLTDPDGPVADALGTDLARARAELAAMDAQALVAVGVDAPELPAVEPVRFGARVPFTGAAKEVLAQSLRAAAGEGSRRIQPRHLLLALLGRTEPDAAAVLLARMGVDRALVRQRLAGAA